MDGASAAFKRIAFHDVDSQAATHIVVQYIGDNTVADSPPHGSSKQPDKARPFKRTMPSVLTRIAGQVKDHQSSAVHKGANNRRVPTHLIPAADVLS